LGGVVAVAAGIDQADFGVNALDEGVGDAELDGDYGFEVFLQAFAECCECGDATTFWPR
jgi:hypothetical protein